MVRVHDFGEQVRHPAQGVARLLPVGVQKEIPADGHQRRPLALLLPHRLFRTHADAQPDRRKRLLHTQCSIDHPTPRLRHSDAHRLDVHVEGPQQGGNPGKIVVFNTEGQAPSRREATYGPR